MAFKRKDWGYSTPLLSPLYPTPPYYYVESEMLMVMYEMDEELLGNLVPEPLEPVGNKCIAFLGGGGRVGTGLGAYLEAGVWPIVKYKNYVGAFECLLYLDSELGICAGREIWGMEKKLASLKLWQQQNIVRGELERVGTRLMSLSVSLEEPAREEDLRDLEFTRDGVFSIKLIPSPEEGQPPEVCELVLTKSQITRLHGLWRGPAAVCFPEPSDLDPVYKFAPRKILGGYYGIVDAVLPFGEIVYRY